MSQSLESRTEPVFENALRSALGLEEANENSFDVKIVAMAKKSYFQNIEFDDGKKMERNTYYNFPAKFFVVEPQLEADDAENDAKPNGAKKIKVASPKKILSTGPPPPSTVLFNPEDLQLNWSNMRRVGAGLMNLGNTCFLNATLQCLTYTPPLFNYLLSGKHSTVCKISGFCMTCELHRHVKKCFENGLSAIRPDSILRNLRVIARHMKWGHQEDAHEFLRYVIDSMLKSQLYGHEKLDPASKETTVVHQIFGGYLRSQVSCLRCQHKSDKFDPFLDISIDLKNVGSVEMGLMKFIQPDTLQGKNAYNCLRCKSNVEAKKCFSFHTTPSVLTFQFKRYSMMGGKVSRHIAFSERLNMRPFMSCRTGEPIMYRLYAVLVHEGSSTSSGHYYCYVRAPNQVWHCINDSHVRPIGVTQVLNAQAYLLFYVREKPAPKTQQMPATKQEKQSQNESNGQKVKVKADLMTKSKAVLGMENVKHSKSTVSPVNGVLKEESTKKSDLLLKNGICLQKKPSETRCLLENGFVREKSSSGVVPEMSEKAPLKKASCTLQNGVATNSSPVNSATFTENVVRNSLSLKRLKNGFASDEHLTKTIGQNNASVVVRVSSKSDSPRKDNAKKHNGCNSALDRDVVSKKGSSEANALDGHVVDASVEKICTTRPSSEKKDLNGFIDRTNDSRNSPPSDCKSQTIFIQIGDEPAEKKSRDSATSKWTVVSYAPPPNVPEPVLVNATGRWTVTPLRTACNGILGGGSGSSAADFRVDGENLSKGDGRQKVIAQCETQRWDHSLSSRYKNISTDGDSRSKTIHRSWDGVRSRKDFLADVAPVALAYGAEVVTWDGEKSFLDKLIEKEKNQKKRNRVDEYNADLDKGRTKKFKKPKVDNFDGVNLFRELQQKSRQEQNSKSGIVSTSCFAR